jgi:hypothetical protein
LFEKEPAQSADAATRDAASKPLIATLARDSTVEVTNEAERQPQVQELYRVMAALASLRTRGGGAAIVEAVAKEAPDRTEQWVGMINKAGKVPDAFSDEDLMALATMPRTERSGENLASYRKSVYQLLVNRGSEVGVLALPAIYRKVSYGDEFLFVLAPRASMNARVPGAIRPETVHRAVADALANGDAASWSDAGVWIDWLKELREEPRSYAVLDAIVEQLDRNPTAKSRTKITGIVIQRFAERFAPFVSKALRNPELRSVAIRNVGPDRRWRSEFEECLGDQDPGVVARAVDLVAEFRDEAAAKLIVPLLDHDDNSVRLEATRALAGLPIADAWQHAAKQLRDPAANVRVAACRVLGSLVEARAVPNLVEMLKDEDVRDEAKSALEKIQFYVDQKARWDKLSAAGGLDATSAAAALLKQAASGQAKEIRLAAIASLGTLAVPETLPMLVGWMSDADPEIAAAAKGAVERMNAAAKKKD